MEETHAPGVTIVVPTLDEEAWIRDCLQSLCSQDYDAIEEILVVDGGSADDTRLIVEDLATRDTRIRLLDNPRRSAAGALNVGLAGASSAVFVRADAHTLYANTYVRR